jgi:hypothetical protein
MNRDCVRLEQTEYPAHLVVYFQVAAKLQAVPMSASDAVDGTSTGIEA